MVLGVTWTLRPNTTTNTTGHSFQTNGAEDTYTDTRYYQRFDMTAWDEVSSTTLQGVTADGTITRTEVVSSGDVPDSPP